MNGESLQPDSAGALERAISAAIAERLPELALLAELIRTLWDPWKVPAAQLKLLAWAWSVDVYEEWWPEPRKRRTIAESRLFHRRKTTVAGIRMSLGYRDAGLVRANLPRHGFFCDVAVTAADQAGWLAALPEIRIFDPAPLLLARPPVGFVGQSLFARGDARLARRAALLRDGIETPLRVIPLADPTRQGERLVLPIPRLPCGIVDRGGRMIVAPNDLGIRTLAVRLGSGDTFERPAATPGEAGTFVQSRRRQVDGARTVFTPAGAGGRRTVAPGAITRGYVSLRFSDEPGRRAARAPLNVVGRSRVMRAPFTANYLVEWARRIPRSRLQPGRRVSARSEPTVLRLMQAIVSAQAARDVNTITLSATRRLTYADLRSVKSGTRYGDRRRN